MNKKVYVISLFVSFLFSQPGVWAAEENGEAGAKGVKRNGFVYNIAEDRKVDKVAGVYEPEGLDIYLNRKLDEVSGRIANLEQKIDQLIQEMKKMQSSEKPRETQSAALV